MWKHLGRVAAITAVGIGAAVLADMVYPWDPEEEPRGLGDGTPTEVKEAEVIDVTPEPA